LAQDVKLSEDHPKYLPQPKHSKYLSRSTLTLSNFEDEENKASIFSTEEKESYPEIIVTECEEQIGVIPEEKPKSKRQSLFEGFNERCAERKKKIEEQKFHDQRLKEVSMDKYPSQSIKKSYKKSTFFYNKRPIINDESTDNM